MGKKHNHADSSSNAQEQDGKPGGRPRFSVREQDNGVEVALHVQPRARRNEIVGVHNGALKVRLTAPPVEGAANQAVIKFFASLLNVPKRNIRIVAGLTSRQKTIRVESITAGQFLKVLPSI